MEAKKNILTYEGLKKYEDELENLKVVKRQEVAQKIKEARAQGDLSENAEYDAAKDEQRDIEARIDELEKILKNAEVIVEDEVDLDKINIGCQVKILDIEMNQELDYKIVGSTEANSLKGKISNESPVGRALIGAKTGDIVRVETPGGELEYQVLEIQKNRMYPEWMRSRQREALKADYEERRAIMDAHPLHVAIAGRMMFKRVMGKASFCNIQDLQGSIQVYVARDSIGEDSYADFKKADIGDIYGLGLCIPYKNRRDLYPCREDDTSFQSLQILPGSSTD